MRYLSDLSASVRMISTITDIRKGAKKCTIHTCMYVGRFAVRWWCQCREGLYALPKTMFDLFKSGWVIFVEGHEALPCWERDPCMDRYVKIKDIKEGTRQADLSQVGQSDESK